MKNNNKSKLVPRLRFPEFWDEPGWEKKTLRAIAKSVTEKAEAEIDHNVLTLSAEHGIVLQSEYFGKKVAGNDPERYIKVSRDDFVYNDRTTSRSTYGTIRRLTQYDEGIVSPIYKCFRFNHEEIPEFWQWYFESGKHDAELAGLVNEGARAGRFNISPDKFLSTTAWCGSHAEQQKIADCLSSLDELIVAEGRKLETLRAHKKGLMQQLFPLPGETVPRLRFPEFRDAGEWEEKRLDACLDYQQPTPYLVSDTDYGPVFKTPVLTAGKTFVLGYTSERYGIFSEDLPVIIFDDFTTATQFVDFPFKVKSSAMKILQAKNGANIKFMFETLRTISYEVGAHERHWISIFAPMLVLVPQPKEQQKIAECLSSLDALIAAQSEKLSVLQRHKKGLMQQLFPSEKEVKV